MKILQINSVCGYGSTGHIAVDLYRAAVQHGDECVIAYGRNGAPHDVDIYKIGTPFDVNLHGAVSRLTDKHAFYSTGATKRFIRWVEEYRPDVVHLHNLHGYYLNIELLFDYLKKSGVPVVWTLHDCWAFTGHCSHFSSAACEKWKTGCYDCPQKGEYPKSFWKDNSAWNYQRKRELFTSLDNMTVVTPSEWLAAVTRKSFLGKYPVVPISNGIDLEELRPVESDFRARYGLEGKKIALGVASIWEKRKGLQELIALSEVLEEDWRVVVGGLTDQQKAEVPPNIAGISRTNSVQELAQIYTAADVYVNVSVEETMGLTTAEALACGTPAVVYNATAVPECVDDTCGIVVFHGEIQALAEAVNRISADPESCRKCAGRFDKHRQYEKYIDLYHQCCPSACCHEAAKQ